jgi:putative transcriptional regulator
MKTKIAERIKELRIENGLNQTVLAARCNVKQSCVSKWERGETLPDAEMIILLTEIFGVSADFLLGIKDF